MFGSISSLSLAEFFASIDRKKAAELKQTELEPAQSDAVGIDPVTTGIDPKSNYGLLYSAYAAESTDLDDWYGNRYSNAVTVPKDEDVPF